MLDAAGSERAVVLTYALGGPVGAVLAAEHPDRIDALIMYASVASSSWAPDYQWAMTREQRDELAERALARRGEPNSPVLARHAPSMAEDPGLNAWFSVLSGSPRVRGGRGLDGRLRPISTRAGSSQASVCRRSS